MYEKLKEERELQHYTMEDMARVIDKSVANYSMKENGKVKFSVCEALMIADFLNKKVEELFKRSDLQ